MSSSMILCSCPLAATADQAVQAAEEMGWPVVMKIASAQILHKSDAGGVVVGLKNGDEVRMAYTRILESACAYEPDAVIDGVVVQKMAGKGEELIMGMNRYPKYGPLLMLGTGMATLRPLLAGHQQGLLPAISCNLALVWAASQSRRWSDQSERLSVPRLQMPPA